LNKLDREEQYELYPFVHSFSNLPSAASQLQPVRIPDVVPGNLPATVDFSMVAGDFLEVYGEHTENQGKKTRANENHKHELFVFFV
jgi:carnosine N-methyltransferase